MRQGGGVIPRRVRNHAGGALAFREIQDSIHSPPELESPHLLEVLTLEEKPRTADGIKLLRGEHRRSVHMRRDQPAGCLNIFKLWNK
jgi:hypothetical protein